MIRVSVSHRRRPHISSRPGNATISSRASRRAENRGIVNLYTREYFQLMRDRLAEGGVATYWLPVYQLQGSDAKAIVGAFCDVFTDCSLWASSGLEWMLVGTNRLHGPVSEQEFTRQWRSLRTSAALGSIGVESPEQLGALFIADDKTLRSFVDGAAVLEDNHPGRLSPVVPATIDPQYYQLMDPSSRRKDSRTASSYARPGQRRSGKRTIDKFELNGIFNHYLISTLLLRTAGLRGAVILEKIVSATPYRAPILYYMLTERESASSQDKRELSRRATSIWRGYWRPTPWLDVVMSKRSATCTRPRGYCQH